ncbi:hypothetical protein COW53_03655, partial [bacterium CG17_big_fil_post_rev_8_21_14_2_50_64_8]
MRMIGRDDSLRRRLVAPLILLLALAGGALAAGTGAPEASARVSAGSWWSVLPPVLAIGLALWTRQVIVAL